MSKQQILNMATLTMIDHARRSKKHKASQSTTRAQLTMAEISEVMSIDSAHHKASLLSIGAAKHTIG